MPEVFAIARGVAIAGADADRIARMPLVMFARATERQGNAGPTLGASADLAVIARTMSQSRRESVAPGDRRLANREAV